MSYVISDSSVELHDPNIIRDVKISSLSFGERFGLLSLQFEKTEMTKNPVFILFTIDRTGSMSEPGNFGDAYNKMYYVKETFKRIAEYISTKDAPIYIKVIIFNTEVETLIDTVMVCSENCGKIVQEIMSVEPDGSTAIDEALQSASTILRQYKEENETHDVYHIFMTDGEPTVGNKNHADLGSMVDRDISTVFIGFGKNHNSQLLYKLSEGSLSNYEVIDNIEHTSVVYGSIMHEILYTSVKNLRLTVEHGEIYDWNTNAWTNVLCEPSIVGESKKMYYLKTYDRENLVIKISGIPSGYAEETHLDDVFLLPDLEDLETGEIYHSCNADLSKHIYRFSVQEILFQSRSLHTGRNITFKRSIANLFRKMRRFMRLNNMSSDPMMSQLCDDLCIVYRTVGTRHGQMFSMARGASQGRQQSNTTSVSLPMNDIDDTFVPVYDSQPTSPRVRKSITPLLHPLDEEDDFEPVSLEEDGDFEQNDYIENHVPSENPISCFATPTAVKTIRSLTTSM